METTLPPERRRRATTLWGALCVKGRRRSFRSPREAIDAYTDWATATTTLQVVFVAVASGLDAFATLLHLREGLDEANPLMALALEHGVAAFVGAKVALTSVGCLVLAAHQHFALGRSALRCLTAAYVVLLAYHLAIFAIR